MAGNSIGTLFKVTTWGESHGLALGVVIDGCPANIPLSGKDIQKEVDRRKPKDSNISTTRKENDKIEILSGVFEGKTTGTPISIIVFNTDARSQDYEKIKKIFRPGHADFTYEMKYGHRDYRGGGRASGRETISRVIAGAVAEKVLKNFSDSKNINIYGHTIQIGNIKSTSYYSSKKINKKFIEENPLRVHEKKTFEEMYKLVEKTKKEGDSIGAIIELIIENLPIGCGEPVFDKLDADLAKAFISIGGVKGVEFGLGFEFATTKGSQTNDQIAKNSQNEISFKSNNMGGILGGISTGQTIVVRLAIKPTPSIAKSIQGESGRHDICLAPRIIVVAEAMAKITILEQLLRNKIV